ncbi:SDR family NAD(P)-dependent oxidoreductase [Streptomyces sp. NPDC047002]|uniref:SDR family NAD(P)-dependent oxidoreductase n=1 Tax=Streptomyces sp. NPDC047002 TaxID=3155475 RepID=UPI003453685E
MKTPPPPRSDRSHRSDIAVVGLACRLPGAEGPEAFWRLLCAGTDAVVARPPGRAGGRPSGRAGYLRAPDTGREAASAEAALAAVHGFEPEFFGMSPREARRTDPQQRLTLELGWEALEDANIVPGSLRASRTGVFLAAGNGEWSGALRAAGAAADVHAYTGTQRGMAAGRLSHVLGLTGPSLTVDTGQSSSLAAVHLACESLRGGGAELALAGGVSLLLDDEADAAVAGTGALSPGGRSAVLDAAADGFVRGEGGALVVLKPLAAALADGDRVYCVLRGSALNHDGGAGALTVPDGAAQEALLAEAYRAAGLGFEAVGYVELHGTGTRAGDPVEAAALGGFARRARRGAALPVGSVKTNIGHLEGAAGIAGLVKAALAVHHGMLPPSLHFTRQHPAIPLDGLGLRVQTALDAWPGPRVAGVSSFGMGGANCHVVMAQAPATPTAPGAPGAGSCGPGAVVWPVSARSPEALGDQLAAVRARLAAQAGGAAGDGLLADAARTLALGRTHFPHRCAAVASSPGEMLDALAELAALDDASGAVVTAPSADPAGPPADVARRHVGGAAVDWAPVCGDGPRAALPPYRFQRRLLLPGDGAAAVAATPEPNAGRGPGAAAGPWKPASNGADGGPDEPFDRMLALVLRETAAVLERDGQHAVPADAAFASLGADSMTVVELTDRLQEALGRPLPSSLVYDHPTPREVARRLARPAGPTAAESAAPAPVPGGKGSGTEGGAGHEPIAIVGMACRFPGGIRSAEELWAAVAGERDLLGGPPQDRGWGGAGLPEGPWRGGFLDDAAGFDAAFFGISPREATAMDPQQRLLLEVGWEAVEHAGIDPASLRGTPTGVYVGVIPQQYDALVQQAGDGLDGYVYTGSTPSVLAGRLSYVLGLEGPALAVDTACSSSLTALHLACRALRSGEVSTALAGGVTVMSTPWMFTDFTAQGALSPDGRSKAFAEAADGTGWSEGVGVLVLEPLSRARREGHRVLAVVRGSALNEDGASNGLTAPNGSAQARVVRAALADAGVRAAEVDAVEAHGPGTRLGDPIEANALLAVYGAEHPRERPLWLGSVKSNIGHTQAAAGVAGVIKTVMAMRHRVLPRTLHVDRPTSRVDWSGGGVRVLTGARPWPATGRPPRAAVSGFGAGGTNAHVVLEAVDDPAGARTAEAAVAAAAAGAVAAERAVTAEVAGGGTGGAGAAEAARPVAFPLAARSAAALADQADRLRTRLSAEPGTPLPDVAWTLARRTAFAHRAVAVAGDLDGLLAELAGIAREHRGSGAEPPAGADGAVFVFPGQGAQWAGMAEGLLGSDPVFTETAEQCASAFARHLDWSVLDVLARAPGAPPLDRVDVAQPALFTVMVALAETWRARGVRPAAVVGHSQGEIAAAYVAGALGLDDAARIVALRSLALRPLQGRGAMAAVSLPPGALLPRLAAWSGALEIAAVNGPAATTVGGTPEALDGLLAALAADGVAYRRLPVGNAGHSRQIEPLREQLLAALAPVAPRDGATPFYSTVTGDRFATGGLDSGYWWRNARQPVLLEPAVRALLAAGHRVFIEVNPHPLLRSALLETFEDAGVPAVALGTLHRDEPPRDRLLASTAEAFRAGLPVDWSALAGPGRPVALPGYPFQHRRYWPSPAAAAPPRDPGGRHPFVTGSLPLGHTGGELVTARVSTAEAPWLTDHALFGAPLVPGAAVAELVAYAARRTGAGRVAELVLTAPLPLPEEGRALDIQVAIERPGADGARGVSVHARERGDGGAAWVRHAHGTLAAAPGPEPFAEAAAWPPRGAREVDLADAYGRLADAGYTYGPRLRALHRMWRGDGEVFAEVALGPGAGPAAGWDAHPVLLDAALHAVLLAEAPADGGSAPLMPFAWSGVRIRPADTASLRVRAARGPDGSWRIDATDPQGAAVLGVDAVSFLPAPGLHPPLLAEEWRPAALDAAPITAADTAVVGPPHPALPAVPAADGLPAAGARVPRTLVVPLDGGPLPLPAALHTAVARHAALLRAFVAEPAFAGSRLVLCTRGATGRRPDPVAAAVAALWRSAAAEHPGQFAHVDSDGAPESEALLPAAVAADLPRVALRGGRALAPVLAPVRDDGLLVPPPGTGAWRLALTGPARQTTPERLALVPAPEYEAPPGPGEVRVRVRAAGLNFVDVITTLGLFPGDAALGREFAGVVTGVGDGVDGVAPGDRVMGIVALDRGAIAPYVVTDHRLVAPVPGGWTFAEAATVPIAFLTAHHGLVALGGLGAGQRVLVHAATGGVGMAALQLARHLGAEVYATAHPDKWPVLAGLGVPPGRTASSRTGAFEEAFRAATGGRGMDVVLDALAGPLVDASLRLLAPGGRFLEMGKLDIRTREQVDAVRPGADYRPFDVLSLPPDGIASAFRDLAALFAAGALRPLPLTAWDVREAREALVTFRDARHTGKLVLTLPRDPRPDGTVLITGGAGTLGAELARHLVRHGARRLLLAGRTPAHDSRIAALRAELAALGAHADYRRADVADPAEVAALLAAVPAAHPLTAVVHAAGVLRDATVASLDPAQAAAVLAPKGDGAWHLHEQTRHLDLAAFTLYGSVAGVVGLPGQAVYGAANAFLDALAAGRAADGLPARSLAWGLWEQRSGMSGHLKDADIARMAAAGVAPLPTRQGLALYEAAAGRPEARLVAMRPTGPSPAAPGPAEPGAAAPEARGREREGGAPGLRGLLSAQPAGRRTGRAAEWIAEQAAAVLRLPGRADVGHGLAFRDLGFDSLTSVELRNRLNAATGLRLPVTVVFDRPTPEALAALVVERLFPPAADGAVRPDSLRPYSAPARSEGGGLPADLAAADGADLLRLIDTELGRPGGDTAGEAR